MAVVRSLFGGNQPKIERVEVPKETDPAVEEAARKARARARERGGAIASIRTSGLGAALSGTLSRPSIAGS